MIVTTPVNAPLSDPESLQRDPLARRRALRLASVVAPINVIEVGLLVAATVIIAVIAIATSIYVAAPIYAVFFMTLTAVRPRLALVYMFATIPVIHDLGLGPVNLAIGEINVLLGLVPLLLLTKRISFYSPFWAAALVYILVCLLSTLANAIETSDIVAILQMLVYLFITTFSFSQLHRKPADLRSALFAMLMVDAVLAGIVILSRASYVLGYHKNAIGAQMCIAVICAAGLWWTSFGKLRAWALVFLLLTSAGLLLSLSRGAWVGTAAGGAIMLMLLGAGRQALKLFLITLPVLALAWISLPEEDRSYAIDISPERRNIQARYNNAHNALQKFEESPLLGVGVGFRKRADATNLFVFVLAETGVIGLAAFFLLIATFARVVWVVNQRMVPTDPLYALFVIGTGLMVAKLGHAMFDHYWQRGMLPIWIGAGMVLQAYASVRPHRASMPTTDDEPSPEDHFSALSFSER